MVPPLLRSRPCSEFFGATGIERLSLINTCTVTAGRAATMLVIELAVELVICLATDRAKRWWWSCGHPFLRV
jgi:hypothetical protein